MFYINKITASEVVDFAAEELKKYLRMMRPEAGNVKISYNDKAKDGFRLGLMSDFGLDTSDVENTELDDIIYIDTKGCEGILAGSNPRSVLFAVYEYLKKQGCGFYYPGIDGEYIPYSATKNPEDLASVKHRFVPTTRYRAQCARISDLDKIDFLAKVGINTVMIEFMNPEATEYNHLLNEENFPPEPVSKEFSKQIKRRCETEYAKRGFQFHDIGHGWLSEAHGFDNSLWRDDRPSLPGHKYPGYHTSLYPEEKIRLIAMKEGERKLIYGVPLFTQLCMSNEAARKPVIDYVADYADTHTNIDYLHVWLNDIANNHCECDACRKKVPSDWYVLLLNEIDEELTRRGNDMKVTFIVYHDTIWAPISEKIKNPDRFLLLFAPILRSYYESLPKEPHTTEIKPFVLNNTKEPEHLYDYFAYLKEWDKAFPGDKISFEYNFWRHQTYDFTGLETAKRVYEDARAYEANGFSGIIQNWLPSFFPNGLGYYAYAKALYDKSLTLDEIIEEYFKGVYGDDWREIYDIFVKMSEILPADYISSTSAFRRANVYISEEVAKALPEMDALLEKEKKFVEAHYNSDRRVRTLTIRLLEKHIEFVTLMSEIFLAKATGENDKALELFDAARIKFGRHESAIGKYFDHALYFSALRICARVKIENLVNFLA